MKASGDAASLRCGSPRLLESADDAPVGDGGGKYDPEWIEAFHRFQLTRSIDDAYGLPTPAVPRTTSATVVGVTDPLTGYLRVKTVCVFRRGGRILAIDAFDPTKRERFWVPIGGRVEFGETSREAIAREVKEELSAEVDDLALLGVLENIFTFDGGDGHEIVFVYDGQLTELSLYEKAFVTGVEGNGQEFIAHWIDPRNPEQGRPVYPDGLVDLLP